jgi:hypothetical protein
MAISLAPEISKLISSIAEGANLTESHVVSLTKVAAQSYTSLTNAGLTHEQATAKITAAIKTSVQNVSNSSVVKAAQVVNNIKTAIGSATK